MDVTLPARQGNPDAPNWVVFNPNAGKKSEWLPEGEDRVAWVKSTSAAQTTAIARAAAETGIERLITVGGDGTFRDAANSLIGTETAIGIVPLGTANDYATMLGLPRDPKQALEIALTAPLHAVETAQIEGRPDSVNLAGIGFDAEVVRRYHKQGGMTKALGPTFRYYAAIISTFRGFGGARATLTFDDEPVEVEKLMLLAFGPAQQYGNGMKIQPHADLTDGYLNATWAESLSGMELAGLLPKLKTAGHLGHPKVFTRKFKHLRIETDPPLSLHIEGDLHGETPADVRVRPAALKVAIPNPVAIAGQNV